jgi:hypothetical protein
MARVTPEQSLRVRQSFALEHPTVRTRLVLPPVPPSWKDIDRHPDHHDLCNNIPAGTVFYTDPCFLCHQEVVKCLDFYDRFLQLDDQDRVIRIISTADFKVDLITGHRVNFRNGVNEPNPSLRDYFIFGYRWGDARMNFWVGTPGHLTLNPPAKGTYDIANIARSKVVEIATTNKEKWQALAEYKHDCPETKRLYEEQQERFRLMGELAPRRRQYIPYSVQSDSQPSWFRNGSDRGSPYYATYDGGVGQWVDPNGSYWESGEGGMNQWIDTNAKPPTQYG